MAPGLTVDMREDGDACTLALIGELALADAATLEDQINIGLRSGAARIIVDIAGVEFVDSTGLGVLVRGKQRAGEIEVEFGIINPTAQVSRLLDLTGLAERLTLQGPTAPAPGSSDD